MDAIREESKQRELAYSNSRYHTDYQDGEMVIWDSLAKKFILLADGYYQLPSFELGEAVYTPDGKHIIGKRITEQQAYLLSHKPLHIDLLDILNHWDKIEIVAAEKPKGYKSDQPFYVKDNIYWKFKIEHRKYPGYYYIPGYTRYIINEEGKILNHVDVDGVVRAEGISHQGYIKVRLVSDSGRSRLPLLHRLLGYTFKDWGLDVMEMTIDHQNTNRQDNSLDNLVWMPHEENSRLASVRAKGRKATAIGTLLKVNGQFIDVEKVPNIVVYDLKENVRSEFTTVAQIERSLDIKETAIHNHLKERLIPYGVIKGKYLIVYKLNGLDDPLYPEKIHEIKDQIVYRAGSQKRKVLILNMETKEVLEYPSAASIYFKLVHKPGYESLTKKIVEKAVHSDPLKIIDGKFVLKYSDNNTPWPNH